MTNTPLERILKRSRGVLLRRERGNNMNIQRIRAIFVKDFKELMKSSQALVPMILVPLIFVIVLPVVLSLSSANPSMYMGGGTEQFLKHFPEKLFPGAFDAKQKILYAMFVYFFAPLFLIIPVLVSSVIASNSFAGEKERKTIEGLLYTPVTDKELIIGKILFSLVPAVIISWLCFIIYSVIVNVLCFKLFHNIFFPTPTWIIMMLGLVPAISFISLALIIFVSQKANSVWEAQQISVVLILPVLGLVLSQAAGVMYMSPAIVAVAGLVCLVLDVVSYWCIVDNFDREKIITKFT